MLNPKLLDKLNVLKTKLQRPINIFQFEYYRKISKKLSDPSTSPKCYWALLKTLKDSFFIKDFFRITNLSLISKERASSLTLSLQNSIH